MKEYKKLQKKLLLISSGGRDISTHKNLNRNQYLIPHTKINSKWSTDINVKTKKARRKKKKLIYNREQIDSCQRSGVGETDERGHKVQTSSYKTSKS